MFSYIFMKILEGRPRSYDRRIERLSGQRIRETRDQVVAAVPPGAKVLEIGCGTGKLARILVSSGRTVDGFDLSASMVAVAGERIETERLAGKLDVWEMGVDAMDSLPDGAYDAVVSVLVFSELAEDERRFALRHAFRTLKPGGQLVIADEVVPRTGGRKALHALFRLPLVAATYLIARSSSRPVEDLAGEISRAGFAIQNEERSHGDAFAVVIARRTAGHVRP